MNLTSREDISNKYLSKIIHEQQITIDARDKEILNLHNLYGKHIEGIQKRWKIEEEAMVNELSFRGNKIVELTDTIECLNSMIDNEEIDADAESYVVNYKGQDCPVYLIQGSEDLFILDPDTDEDIKIDEVLPRDVE